jgi:hypothetical protein
VGGCPPRRTSWRTPLRTSRKTIPQDTSGRHFRRTHRMEHWRTLQLVLQGAMLTYEQGKGKALASLNSGPLCKCAYPPEVYSGVLTRVSSRGSSRVSSVRVFSGGVSILFLYQKLYSLIHTLGCSSRQDTLTILFIYRKLYSLNILYSRGS